MPPDAPPRDGLAATALQTLRAFFDTAGHNPSVDHWQALAAIAETMEAMASGTCAPKVFLSSVDPGVGKSQTVIHYARALIASPDHKTAGMIVCVGRIAEAAALATDLADVRQHVAVLTSDDATNSLGGAAPHEAQVLITTQQRPGADNNTATPGTRDRGPGLWGQRGIPFPRAPARRSGLGRGLPTRGSNYNRQRRSVWVAQTGARHFRRRWAKGAASSTMCATRRRPSAARWT